MKTSAYLYIIADNGASKIGVTEQALEKRFSAYKTHNPNAHLFANYQFASIEQARGIEDIVRRRFAPQQAGAGKEWFLVPPADVATFVLPLVRALVPPSELRSPLMQSSQPPPQMLNLLYELGDLLRDPLATSRSLKAEIERRDRITEVKRECQKSFRSHFHLGLSDEDVKVERLTTFRDAPAPDMTAIRRTGQFDSVQVRTFVMQPSKLRFPAEDHQCYFWQLHPLTSGFALPFVHTTIIMPYVRHLAHAELQDLTAQSKRFARTIGWNFTDLSEWSWHLPGSTALFAYQMQTDAKSIQKEFSTSLRRFVIERYSYLDTKHCDRTGFEKVLSDLAADSTFPAWIRSYEELVDTYLGPAWGHSLDDDDPTARAYRTLFDEWRIWLEATPEDVV